MFSIDPQILKSNSQRWHYQELCELVSATEERFSEIAAKSSEKDYQALLTDFFGKAVLYIKEIYTLLYNGFADGAMTLAGELFEASVLLSFIDKNKNDEGIAERYFDNIELSSIVDSIKLLSFLKDGATDAETRTGLEDAVARKQRTYSSLKTKHIKFLSDGVFRPYWWLGFNLEENEKSFSGILKKTVWEKTLFKHIYNMSKHAGHNAVNPYENGEGAVINADPSTEGFQIPLCFATASFVNISKIVFMNDEIAFADIEDRLNKITKPIFAEIWK